MGSVETDSSHPRREEALHRLGRRIEEDVGERDTIHLGVEVAESASSAAAVRFWEAIRDRLAVLATDPEPEEIEEAAFDDRFDVLAASDVPSPVVAARLMRIDVGKELEPTSTVTVDPETGDPINARSWTVEIVDDGSPPGWDEPARLAAGQRAAAKPSDESRATRAEARGSTHTEGSGDDPSPAEPAGQSSAGRDGTVERRQSGAAGAAPASEEHATGEMAGDAAGSRSADPDPGEPEPGDHEAGDHKAGEHEEEALADLDLDRIAAALAALDGAAGHDPLAAGDERTSEDGLAVQLTRLRARLQSMEGYAAVVEQFVDEHGTPRRAFDGVLEDVEGLRADLEALEASLDDLDEDLEETTVSLATRVDDLEGRIESQAAIQDEHGERVADHGASLDRHEELLEQHDQTLERHEELIDRSEDRLETLEETAGRLFALQRAQWEELRERIDEVEAHERERIEDLEESIEERDRTLRRTLAAWITDAELELLELDERIDANEAWRRSLSAAAVLDTDHR